LRTFERRGGDWWLRGDRFEDSVDYLIDATGRRALIARRLDPGFSYGDKTIAVGVTYRRQSAPCPYLRVEHVERGWWYFIDSRESTTAVFVTTKSFSTPKSVPLLFEALGNSSWAQETRRCFSTWSVSKPVDATPRLRAAAGNSWLAVGDAAASFDPISSQGIANALSSAWFASQALLDHHQGDTNALPVYHAAVDLTWKRTLRLQDQVYGNR